MVADEPNIESPDEEPGEQRPLAAARCSASPWTGRLAAMEQKTDDLREAAYKAGNYRLASELLKIERAFYKLLTKERQTPNEKS